VRTAILMRSRDGKRWENMNATAKALLDVERKRAVEAERPQVRWLGLEKILV